MDYRKKYIEKYGIIPNNFEVHHLDGDRCNNEFENLVAIPKDIHNKYHNIKSKMINFLKMFRDFRSLPKKTNIGIIDEYKKITDVIFEYEMQRDSKSITEYSGKGINKFKEIFK